MTRKCRTCAHNTCEGYSNECTDCTEHSEWKEARFVQEIRREEREACARICEEAALVYNYETAKECADRIRAEGSGR